MRLISCLQASLASLMLAMAITASAQTPILLTTGTTVADSVYLQDFDTQPGATGLTLPAGWLAYDSSGSGWNPKALLLAPGTSGAYNYGSKVGFCAQKVNTNHFGLVSAFASTAHRTGFKASYRLTIESKGAIGLNPQQDAQVVLQYSLTSPTSGFQDVAGSYFVTTGLPAGTDSVITVNLPADIENLNTPVYLRVYYYPLPGGIPFLGQYDGVSVDDFRLSWTLNTISPLAKLNRPTLTCGVIFPRLGTQAISDASYAWFLNGNPLPSATDSITASASGLYKVVVSSPSLGTGTDSVQITLKNSPENVSFNQAIPFTGQYRAGTQADPDQACVFDILNYSIPNPGPLYPNSQFQQTWDFNRLTIEEVQTGANFGGGILLIPPQSANANLRLRPGRIDAGKTYEITLRATDLSSGCYSDTKRYLTIKPSPFSGLAPETLSCGQPIVLTANQGLQSPVWSDGSTGLSITVSNPGIYWFESTNAASGCRLRDTIRVVPDNRSIGFGNDTTVCGSVVLKSQVEGVSYLWSTGQTTPELLVSQNISNLVLRVTTAGGCVKYDTISVQVKPLPSSLLPPTASFCGNEPLTLEASTVADSAHWWQNNIRLVSSGNSIVVYDQATYVVEVFQNGCSVRDTIIVSRRPIPALELGNDVTHCGPYTIVPQLGNSKVSFSWSFGVSTPTFTATFPGTYYLEITDSNGCKNRDSINVNILDRLTVDIKVLPAETLTVGQFATLVAKPNRAVTQYQWDFGNGVTSNLGDSVFVNYSQPGEYTVRLKVTNTVCGEVTFTKKLLVQSPNARDENSPWTKLQLSPNPAKGFFQLQGLDNPNGNEVEIIDLAGRTWGRHSLNDQARVDVSRMPAGLYMVRVWQAGAASVPLKLVIE